jgi:hypothetical protein
MLNNYNALITQKNMFKKHSFQEVEESSNERLKEELTMALILDLKMAKQTEGILTNIEIAHAIKEGLGDDAPSVVGTLLILCANKKAEFKKGIGIVCPL